MSKGLKRLIIFAGVLLALAIFLASFIAYFNEAKLRSIVVQQLNNLLETEVKVESIELSLLKRFPKASIEFNNIEITEKSSRSEKLALLKASSLFLEFDPFDLFRGKYIIDQIYLSGAVLNVTYFKDGSNNFEFFKSDSTDEFFQILLQKVQVDETHINYSDATMDFNFSAFVENLKMTGDFNSHEFELSIQTSANLDNFKLQKFKISRPYLLALDFVLSVDNDESLYTIKKASIGLDQINFVLNGSYKDLSDGGQWDISLNTEKFQLSDFQSLFKERAQNYLEGYEMNGIFIFQASVKGLSDKKHNPAVAVNFKIEDGSVNHIKSGTDFKEIVLRGSYSNGSEQNMSSSTINIEELSFLGKHGKSVGNFSIVNFKNPLLKCDISSVIDLGRLREIISNDSLEVLEGVCRLNFQAETYLDSLSGLTANNLKQVRAHGDAIIESGQFKWKGYKFKADDINAYLKFGDNFIYIDSLKYTTAGIVSTIQGKLQNLLPFLFFPNEKLMAQADVYYKDLNVNVLIDDGSESDKAGFVLPVSEHIVFNIKLKADNFKYKNFQSEKVECEIVSKYPYFIAQKLSVNSMEGQVRGWLQFDLSNLDKIACASQLVLEHINIHDLFVRFNNFGQSTILAENLKGITNSNIDFKANFNREFSIDLESIEAIWHADIRNGELINFDPVMGLSKYVDIDELKDIKFSKLINDIEIKNKMIYIPEMEIKSTALELKLSGKHSFDNDIDYHFQLYLSDILFKKAKRSKKNQEEFGTVETDESGRAKLFVRMQGTVDEYEIKLDRKAVREEWKDDFKSERQTLNDLFKSEFGSEKKKTPESKVKYELEWEELKPKNQTVDSTPGKSETQKRLDESKSDKKNKPLTDKLGKKVEDEYEEYDPSKFD